MLNKYTFITIMEEKIEKLSYIKYLYQINILFLWNKIISIMKGLIWWQTSNLIFWLGISCLIGNFKTFEDNVKDYNRN